MSGWSIQAQALDDGHGRPPDTRPVTLHWESQYLCQIVSTSHSGMPQSLDQLEASTKVRWPLSSNQRPVSWSRDHSQPIKGPSLTATALTPFCYHRLLRLRRPGNQFANRRARDKFKLFKKTEKAAKVAITKASLTYLCRFPQAVFPLSLISWIHNSLSKSRYNNSSSGECSLFLLHASVPTITHNSLSGFAQVRYIFCNPSVQREG